MHLLVHIAGWLCLGVIGFIAFVYVLVGAFGIVAKVQQRRRRRELGAHAAFGSGRGHEHDILAEGLAERLQSIGPYTMSVSGGSREIVWEKPSALPCDFAPVELTFNLEPDNIGPDEATFKLWETYKARHAEHVRQFSGKLIEWHRMVQGDLTEEQALAKVERIYLSINQEGYGDDASHSLHAGFELELDPEHGYSLEYDPETGMFIDVDE